MKKSPLVDRYINEFPPETKKALQQVRAAIRKAAPSATETMGYGIPAYKLADKPLVYFGGFARHVGFYATPGGHSEFSKALSAYRQGRGSVQFPLSEPMPLDLISRMVKFRVKENEASAAVKKSSSGKVSRNATRNKRKTGR